MTIASASILHEPDPDQRKVIASRESSIRVLAPAGSGKTETLGRRVAALIADGVPARRILILTFDNQARASFQASLRRLHVTGNVEIRTLNAFGLRILTQYFPTERNRAGKVFYGPSEPLLAALVEKSDQGNLIEIFSTLKSHLFDPRKVSTRKLETWVQANYRQLVPEKFATDYPEATYAATFATEVRREFKRYEEFLENRRQIDFDDQKLRSLTLLEQNPEVAARIRANYDEIIVDEFQDINPLDLKLIELISREATLVITGEDDQAIYGFRWASADFLIRPAKAFKRPFTSYELRTNYRCPRTILDHSRRLIEKNRNRVSKHPKSGVEAAGAIEILEANDRLAQASGIASLIGEAVRKDPSLTWGDIAVLTRRNQHLDEIQVQLIALGIPYLIRSDRNLIQTWTLALDLLDLSTALRARNAVRSPTTGPRLRDTRGSRARSGGGRGPVRRPRPGRGPALAPAVRPGSRPAPVRAGDRPAAQGTRRGRRARCDQTRFLGYDAKPDKDAAEAPLALLRTILGAAARPGRRTSTACAGSSRKHANPTPSPVPGSSSPPFTGPRAGSGSW